jgi:flagellar basal-body rod protein FlgB
MANDFLQTETLRRLEWAMDASFTRNQLLTQNVANANTPNYKRSDIDFDSVLQDTFSGSQLPMTTTNPAHFTNSSSGTSINTLPIVRETGTSSRTDGNNVDIEYEMAQISQNSLFYQSLTSVWKQEMSRLKMVIQGRS